MKKTAERKMIDGGAKAVKSYKTAPQQCYRLKRDIVIKKGTVFYPGPVKIDLAAGHGEAFVALGRDNSLNAIVDMDGLDDATDSHLRRVMRRTFEKIDPPQT